jgi:hypothetical protein
MPALTEFIAILATTPFAGAAIYINSSTQLSSNSQMPTRATVRPPM